MRGSKSISANKNAKIYWAHERGLKSEQRVLQYYQGRGCKLLSQRLKTPFAEVDLLLKDPRGFLVIVEVKSANLSSFYSSRISRNQKLRLFRAAQFLAECWGCLVEVHWAFVGPHGQVTAIEDIC